MIYQTIRTAMPVSGLKGVAMAFAATRIAERVVGRNKTLRRAMRVVNTAAWAVPLGLFAWRHLGPQNPEPAAGD